MIKCKFETTEKISNHAIGFALTCNYVFVFSSHATWSELQVFTEIKPRVSSCL
jgi:hypothetical protein